MVDGERTLVPQASIDDLGDLRTTGALRTIDGSGLIVAPLFDSSITAGQDIQLPDWKAHPSERRIAPGQPGELLLLSPRGTGYHVELVLKF
jgi:hypothetical protein